MQLKPSEIYFSQAEINNRFDRNSTHPYNVGRTLDMLVDGMCSIHHIPTISVMWRNDRWVTADNRRLWVFRHLEKLGKCTTIPVKETYHIDFRKLNSMNGGRTVRFYSGRYADGKWHQRVASIDPGVTPHTYNSEIQANNVTRTVSNRSPFSYSQGHLAGYNRLLNSLTSMQLTSNYQELDPSEIRYTKESITVEFSNRTPRSDMEPITVYKVYNKYWVTDGNKRLWVCRNAQQQNPFLKIKAKVKDDKDKFLDEVRKDRPYLSLLDILQSGDNIQVS